MKQINAANTDGPQRIAVVGVANAEKRVAIFRTLGFLAMILVRHLQSDFDRRRPAVRKEDFRQPRRSPFPVCHPAGGTDTALHNCILRSTIRSLRSRGVALFATDMAFLLL